MCLRYDIIKSFPWYNVPKECNTKRSSSMTSDFNGHLSSKLIINFLYLYDSYLRSSPVSIELNCLHYHDLSLLLPFFYCSSFDVVLCLTCRADLMHIKYLYLHISDLITSFIAFLLDSVFLQINFYKILLNSLGQSLLF